MRLGSWRSRSCGMLRSITACCLSVCLMPSECDMWAPEPVRGGFPGKMVGAADPRPEILGIRCVLHRVSLLPRDQQLPGPVFVFCHYNAGPAPARPPVGSPRGSRGRGQIRGSSPRTVEGDRRDLRRYNCSSSCWIISSGLALTTYFTCLPFLLNLGHYPQGTTCPYLPIACRAGFILISVQLFTVIFKYILAVIICID